MMLGIIDPDEGTSRLFGGLTPQSVRGRIGNLPEERGLYPGMKAREAIAFMRSEEHTSELQSLMRISYAVFCLKKKKKNASTQHHDYIIQNAQVKTHRYYAPSAQAD